jgi:hypothetical protein
MNRLTSILMAAVCSVTLLGTGCSGSSSNSDSGPSGTDSGPVSNPDSGQQQSNPDSGQGPIDAGVDCDGGNGCYNCAPTTYDQIVNHCTTAQQISKNPTLPLLPDGGFPALP